MWKHKSLPCSLPQLNHNLLGQGTGTADHLTLLRHFSPFSFSCRISPPSLSHSHAVKLYILFFATFGVSLLDRLALDIRVLLLDCVVQMWDFLCSRGGQCHWKMKWDVSFYNLVRVSSIDARLFFHILTEAVSQDTLDLAICFKVMMNDPNFLIFFFLDVHIKVYLLCVLCANNVICTYYTSFWDHRLTNVSIVFLRPFHCPFPLCPKWITMFKWFFFSPISLSISHVSKVNYDVKMVLSFLLNGSRVTLS